MNSERCFVIRFAAESAGFPEATAASLVDDCPWLSGSDEIAEEVAIDLLGEGSELRLSANQVHKFTSAYNDRVRAVLAPFEEIRARAVAALVEALSREGREDNFDDGDYSFVEGSLATATPIVNLLNGFCPSREGVQVLAQVLSTFPTVYSEIRLSSKTETRVITVETGS